MNRTPAETGQSLDAGLGPSIADRVLQVVDDCIRRRRLGELLSDESLCAAHVELMPDLAQALRHLQLLENACHARTPDAAADPEFAHTTARSEGLSIATQQLRVRCPHCHDPQDVVTDGELTDLHCFSCGSQFSLLGGAEVSLAPRAIRHFQLFEQLGTGGSGSVWKAWDAKLDRFVAIKVPRRGQLTSPEEEQFLREARTAAQLRHPHIVSVHEAGRDGNTIYIVSDFIDGESLAEFLAREQPTAREAAALCQTLAEALHYAHELGIVHRDVKPANVLLDATEQPHISDFGLARRETGEITLTLEGVVVGTPAYMSPEQARGDSHQADRRSDLYSLGVILFELLTGELPFRGNVRIVTQQILTEDSPSPRQLNPTVPRDLANICLKCLEKDPRRRYASAQDLAQDLGRFRRGEPTVARPITPAQRFWRWCRRRPTVAGLTAALGASLVILAVASMAYSVRMQGKARQSRWQVYLADMHSAMKAWEESDVGRVVETLARHRPAPGEEDLRRFEWYYLWRQCQPGLSTVTFQNHDGVWAVAPSADGTKVVAGNRSSRADTVLNVWDVKSGERLYSLSGQNAVHSVAISPDDRSFASVGTDRPLCIWDLATGKSIRKIIVNDEPSIYVPAMAISPDGGLVATTGTNQTAKLWDFTTGELIHVFEAPNTVFCRGSLAFAPDGQTLAAGAQDGGVWMWNVPSRSLIQIVHGHSGLVSGVAFSPNGQVFATVGEDRLVRLWKTSDRSLLNSLVGHTNVVPAVDFSADSSLLATAGGRDGTVRVWDVNTGNERYCFRGHSGAVNAVRFSGNGVVVSGGSDGAVKLWDLNRKYDVNVLRGDTGQTWSLAISPDGTTVAAGGGDGVTRVWDLASGALLKSHSPEKMPSINAVAWSPDGQWLAIGGELGSLELWNVDTDEIVRLRDGVSQINSLAWSADGRVLVSGDSGDNDVILWDPVTGKERLRLAAHARWISWVAISPDDRTLVTRCEDNTLQVWDLPNGRLRKTIRIPAYFRSPAVFSADGKLLACVDGKHVIQFRETVGWEIVQTAPGHTDHVKHLAFSPDGRTLASASDDGSIRLWEVATGEERCSFLGHRGEVDFVSFTPDGNTLVSCGQDGTVRLWKSADPVECDLIPLIP